VRRLDAGVADMHLHTTTSDGTATVSDRLTQAADRDLDTIAITDHDVVPDAVSERTTCRNGVELVAGVEVRADLFDTKVEILGHFVDPTDSTLQATLERAREFRVERNRTLVESVADETGLDVTHDSLAASVEGGLGRPHVADLLVEEGVIDSIGAAFEEYLGEEGVCFVPMERHPYQRVIDAIHSAGGVASLAHPGRIRASVEVVEEMVATLAEAGLDGIEVPYPYAGDRSEDYAAVGVEAAADLAEEYGLLSTGGSDCHGPGSGKFRIGDVRLTASEMAAIRDRADRRRSFSA
jgi:predicted metal-dependent phosphoesterase TrpH